MSPFTQQTCLQIELTGLSKLDMLDSPPELLPPTAPLTLDCTKSFITVTAAPLTASCLVPEVGCLLSKSFAASAIAMLMSFV
jgi:hypothetical protein